ncbi:conserved Plasmodium protein, unknown function [Plasmodium malariae]|uniref:Uncharacterized protein n=1 Tax=Plasmodium malariae TaxID=5858 RepID=A0A1C3KDC6_PLAMA|nr:conserved Plasmodium protein, unknown function [Plasmodium malariae]
MKCIELYRYSCLLEKQSVNNVAIYKQINRRVEMIYKFLNPSKIVLLIKLYLENANLNLYHSTFNCLLEEAIKKLNEFNLEEIVKLYNIISKVENNQNVVYLFKYFNNHLINYYTFIDVKSFSVLLNSHAKLKIKDMKLINKFLHIIMQNKLPFDVITYSIFFNSFYKLRIVDNEFVTIIVRQFLNEIDESKEKEDSVRIEKFDQNIVHNDKKKTIRNIFIIKNDILVNHIENLLLNYFIYVKDQKNINYNNNNQNVTNSNDFIPFTDNALVKILFDMCTFYNDINIYNYSIQYFRWKKVDFYASSLLLYIYSEINLLDYQMITILIHVINKNYLLNFQVENIFPIIRSFYKICLNNQHYFESTNKSQNFANNMQNCSKTTRHSYRKLSSTCKIPQNEMYNKINDIAKAIPLSANDNPIKTSTQIGYIFCKIENLCDNIFSKLKKELLEKKIHISRSNISLLCKILFYSTFLRRFAFLNNVINLFIDKKDELESFKNILNILYAYCYIKNNIYSYDINKINLIKVNEKSIIKQHTNDRVLENYNFIINKLNHNNELTNMISFLFIQCKLNDYRFVNEESITTWLKFSFLNIHLLSLLLNSLISKELNIITNFTANDRTEILLETIGNKKKGNDIKNSHIIVKNVYKLHLMKLYNLILVQINKLILKCQNVYDITRIFNSSFIFLSYFGKLKNEQKLNGEDLQVQTNSDDPFRDVSTSDNEYVIYVNDENAFINMENKETKEEEEEEEEEFNDDHHDEKDESKMELEISNSKKITVTAKSSKNDMQLVMQNKETDKDTHLSNYHKETNQIKNIKKMDHTTHINDHSFIILFLLLDLVKNDQRIKQAEIYNFNFSLFKNYIYILNKEVIIQCLYIYFYSESNEKLEHDNKLRGNRVIDEHVHYILNVLITFIHNLDVYSILKLSFIYINLYLYSNKKYQVNENIKILFEHINKKKNLIEKNNILYEQIKRYENISNL